MKSPLSSLAVRAAIAALLLTVASQAVAAPRRPPVKTLPAPIAVVFGGLAFAAAGLFGRKRRKAGDQARASELSRTESPQK